MTRIIAGVFETFDEAERARQALAAAGFPAADTCSFFNNAPGQHADFKIGGDEDVDPKATHAHTGAAGGAALGAGIGLAAGLAAGPAALAIAGVGAYVGSLAGASSGTEDEDAHNVRRPAGVMVAVNIGADLRREAEAIRALRTSGADNIERAEGAWHGGTWADFDPVANPVLVEQSQLHGPGTHE